MLAPSKPRRAAKRARPAAAGSAATAPGDGGASAAASAAAAAYAEELRLVSPRVDRVAREFMAKVSAHAAFVDQAAARSTSVADPLCKLPDIGAALTRGVHERLLTAGHCASNDLTQAVAALMNRRHEVELLGACAALADPARAAALVVGGEDGFSADARCEAVVSGRDVSERLLDTAAPRWWAAVRPRRDPSDAGWVARLRVHHAEYKAAAVAFTVRAHGRPGVGAYAGNRVLFVNLPASAARARQHAGAPAALADAAALPPPLAALAAQFL
jgi:hypothetical protein